MTLKALRPKPTRYSFWQKLAMTMGCLVVCFLGAPFVKLGDYLFNQGTFFGVIFGIVIGIAGVLVSLWSLVLVFRVWAGRWPFREVGEPIF